MRTIGVVTVARSDFGLYRPVLRSIRATRGLALSLMASGGHLVPALGETVREIEADGIAVDHRVATGGPPATPCAVGEAMARALAHFARVFARARPDVLLVLGDRYEMHAAALAALPFGIPVAHLHGGESSEGAIDDALRHSLTKLAHLHFVATEAARRRVIRMGEAPWRVLRTGAPGLDAARLAEELPAPKFTRRTGIPLDPAPLLVTLHPTTLRPAETARETAALLGALDKIGRPVVFTYPGSDVGSRSIIDEIERYLRSHPSARVCANLGTPLYFTLMRHAAVMVGNSSSGIIEAASFRLPVVNVGQRQRGRLRGANVIDAAGTREAIVRAVARALSPRFRAGLARLRNPYGDGGAAARIVRVLGTVRLDERLLLKRFHDG